MLKQDRIQIDQQNIRHGLVMEQEQEHPVSSIPVPISLRAYDTIQTAVRASIQWTVGG